MDDTRRKGKRTGQYTSTMCVDFLTEARRGQRTRSDFFSRVSTFVGSTLFDVVGRPELFGAGWQRSTEGTAIIAAQLTGITILAGVFFRKIEAHFRSEYFSFNIWNDNKRQGASLILLSSHT